MTSYQDQAIKKIRTAKMPAGQKASAVAPAVADALVDFCRQDEEFAQAVAQGGEIRAEGKALCHCVGGYAKRHMEGATTILFLRAADDPDTPLCTIEMEQDGKNIRQIHGYRNDRGLKSPKKLYAAFLDIWLPWVAAGSRRDPQGRPILPSEQTIEQLNTAKEAV